MLSAESRRPKASSSRLTIRLPYLVAGAALACALAACSGGGATGSTPGASPTSPPASTPASGATSAAGGSVTGAGTRLKVGQPALVDYQPTFQSTPSYRLQVTITSITPGTMADFKDMATTGVPADSTPTYVKVTIMNLSGQAIDTHANDPFNSVQAIDGSNTDDSVTIGGDFPPCPQPDTPNPFAAGQSFSSCETFTESKEATQIGWTGGSDTLEKPIIWSP